MRSLGFAVFLCLVSCGSGVALAAQSFLPENNLHEQDSLFSDSKVTEEDFNGVIQYYQYVYAPIVSRYGARLVIQGNWRDSTVNAYANNEGNTWKVQMFGGLARRPEVTVEGFAAVVCHELGHHLAGFPFYRNWVGSASNEGNSDYFAMMSCIRETFKSNSFISFGNKKSAVDDTAINKCNSVYTTEKDRNICYWTMEASWSLASLLAGLGGETVSFDSYDPKVVRQTSDSHPAAQCRLDTMVAGALCPKTWNPMAMPRTQAQAFEQTCPSGVGARSRCWFAPR